MIGTIPSQNSTCQDAELESGEKIVCNLSFSGVELKAPSRYSVDISINFTDVGSTFMPTSIDKGVVFGPSISST